MDDEVEPLYDAYVPSEQCGATKRRSTDMATHIVRSFIDLAALRGMACSIVCIDLIKAFDCAIRETVIGWPQIPLSDRVDFLHNLGLNQSHAKQIVHEIQSDGCVLEQLNAHPHVIALVSSLHTFLVQIWELSGCDGCGDWRSPRMQVWRAHI